MGNKTRVYTIVILSIVIIGFAVFYLYPKLKVTSAVKTNAIKTAVVDRGTVTSSIVASGIVESENEVLILSPARSIIKKVYKEPGSWIEKGELIVGLDKENVEAEIENLVDQLEMKRNSLEKTQLNAESTQLDLRYNEEVKKLKITSLKSTLADQEQLLEVGGISPARIENTRQEITLAEKDLETLIQKNSIRLKQLETDEKGLMLQIKVQEKLLQEKRDLLQKLDIVAPSAGIILAVAGNEGVRVDADKMLVRMSDLSSFKVIGSINEEHAKRLKTGNRVYVKLDGEELPGRVGNITPMVENQRVQFNVHLKDKSHPKLIANQNVEVHVINSNKDEVLRIEKPEDFDGDKNAVFYVVRGNEAVKTNVVLGSIGNDYCEIVSGLNEGDEVVVKGINARGLDRINIEN